MEQMNYRDMLNFDDKVVLVTGASGGIGSAVCNAFLECGATVIGIGRRETIPNKTIDYRTCDVISSEGCEKAAREVVEKYGRIDVLINCAGITSDAMTGKMTEEQFDDVIAVNLKGTWNITRSVGTYMRQAGKGAIVNISSVVGIYGNIGQVNYAASKAGVIGMTKVWAKEYALKGCNIRVNAVAPGYTMTDMLKPVPAKLLERFASQTDLGRLARPEEIASCVLFLASDLAGYVTGAVLQADGGLRL